MRTLRGRAVAVAVSVVLAILYLLPTFVPLPSWWTRVFPDSRIRLGLDLRGGLYLTLEVQTDEAIASHVDQSIETVRSGLARAGLEGTVARVGTDALEVRLAPGANVASARQVLSDALPDFSIAPPGPGDAALRARLKPEVASKIREGAVEQALATLRGRIDQYGVAEPSIQRQGPNRIVLQLPGVQHPEEVRHLIGTTARLEFKEVDDASNLMTPLLGALPAGVTIKQDEVRFSDKEKPPLRPPYLVADRPDALRALAAGKVPPTHQVLIGEEPGLAGGRSRYRTWLVKSPTLMTGEGVVDARVQFAQTTGAPVVVFEFDDASARRFADLTERLKGRRMAVIVDGIVRSGPMIDQRISGGQALISGQMKDTQARDLAIMLRTGALRASVKPVAQQTVGPSLGRDSVRRGVLATLAGLVIVIGFMIVYYRTAGGFAAAALLFNMALILAALAAFGATLTLPGIAGIALTVGMAVDANVLIFERIREEIRNGKTFRAAVDAGFDRAVRTIVDANATTLIAALVLYYYGTGPVRGFAVTLSVGIFGTLFTALVLTRLLFDVWLGPRRRKAVAI
jgi:preprotein translocase subunit SecD